MSNRTSPHTPVVVASENGRYGALAAMELLKQGGSALDAVELACRVVEGDGAEHSVGYGGIPNAAGDVELDASIMDGTTLATGAVAGVYGYAHPISLARRLMEQLPHVMLVGRGAERFARELGEMPADQRNDEGMRLWRQRFHEYGIAFPAPEQDLRQTASLLTRPLHLRDMAAPAEQSDVTGTVDFLVLDALGHLASAVSTSGLAWKYPGRVGDSPIIGAGNYCDNRYGAVACTGMGELAIRVSTARSVILYMKMGMTMVEAGMEALHELHSLTVEPGRYMNFVVLTPTGEHAGFTTSPGKQYLYLSAEMESPELADRLTLPAG